MIHPRQSQRPVLQNLSPQQLEDVYERVKDLPTDQQHCGIEQYLVALGVATPTDYCQALFPSMATPRRLGTTNVPNSAVPNSAVPNSAVPNSAVPNSAVPKQQDRAPISATQATVATRPFNTSAASAQDEGIPVWAWVIIGIVGALFLALIIALIVVAANNAKRQQMGAVAGRSDMTVKSGFT